MVSVSNVALSGEQTIDGVLTSASRVLLTAQTAGEENGIWVTAAGAWSRATDYDTAPEIRPGVPIVAIDGKAYQFSIWFLTTTAAITVGVTALSYLWYNPSDPANYGNGTHGSVNYAVNQTLAADVLADNVTVQAGVVVSSAGYAIRARQWINIKATGVIRRNGNNATTSTGASALAAGSTANTSLGGANGGVSPATPGGNGNGSLNVGWGGNSGAGGAGTGAAGGTAGIMIINTGNRSRLEQSAWQALQGFIYFQSVTASACVPGGGGAGGGPGAAAAGGGGGSGGGWISLAAPIIYLDGTVEAKGGNGAAGTGAGAGGGGGGGGGVIVIVSNRAPIGAGTVDVSGGGAGASGGGGGSAGSAGSAGRYVKLWPGSTP